MPIQSANKTVKKKLEKLATESWLDAAAINKMFKTAAQKKKLLELQKKLAAAKKANESAAATWGKLGTIKDVALKLLKKSVGVS